MDIEAINEAIAAARNWVADAERAYKEERGSYFGVSMRQVLQDRLGYSNVEANEVIREVANRGFEYCLDPMIAATHFDPNNPRAGKDPTSRDYQMVTDYPDRFACEWGIDQLRSRLDCVL